MVSKYARDQPSGFANRVERIAIIGAGGRMGARIVGQLLAGGKHTLTAITRPNSTSQIPEDVEVVRLDYASDDQAALIEALQDQEALIITMSVMAPRDTIPKLMLAADRAGVRYVLPNWFGHDPAHEPLLKDTMLSEMRRNIQTTAESLSTSSYILLCNNFWYEFSLGGGSDRFGFDFQQQSLTLFDDGRTPINVTTWAQCGRAVAYLFRLKELPDNEIDTSPTISMFRNRAIYVSSFRLSQHDMFESVKRVTGTVDGDWKISMQKVQDRWAESHAKVKQGDFSAFPRMLYGRTFFPGGGGEYESTRGLHNHILGLEQEDLDENTAIAVEMGKKFDGDSGH